MVLDDNGREETEAENDIPGNRWLDVIPVQSEVAQSRNTVIDGVVHSVDSNRTDIGAAYTCNAKTGLRDHPINRCQIKQE